LGKLGVIEVASLRRCVLAVLLVSAPSAAQAEAQADPTADILVRGRAASLAVPFETRHALDARDIAPIGAGSADEIVRRLPSLYVPTNSRGEAIAFLRSAADRQIALFYDGAAINVPWDNRLDLSLVPSALIGSARMAAAPLAPLYGANALGAVSFSPLEPDSIAGRSFVGSGGIRDVQGVVPFSLGNSRLTVGGSHAVRHGDPLSDNASLPFSQPGETLRTNTDRDLSSVFARLGTTDAGNTLSLTAFHVWGSKGIAPESDRASGARFWRYPNVEHTLVSANAGLVLGDRTALAVVGWYQRFNQTIDSFTDVTYRRRDGQEANRDRTVGARALLTRSLGDIRVTGSINMLDSVHHQRDVAYTGGAAPTALPAFIEYHQRNWSFGGDVSAAPIPSLIAEVGLGYDRVAYLDTGDKPGVDAANGWTGRVALAWEAGSGWRLRAAAGRKIRAATMRELFGQALNRFLLNPDLQPERIVSGELAAERRGHAVDIFMVGFAQDLDGTIDQRNVGRLRQRINLKGSTVRGVEAGGEWRLAAGWAMGGSVTASRVRRKGAAAGTLNRLAEKPSLLARLYGTYAAPSGFSALVETQHVGRAYSADANGVLVPLRRSTSFNLRISQRVPVKSSAVELFARVDNLGDTLVLPQIGLPAAGRSIRVGLSVGAP
jgi:iron complex outermembrane receptor protein